MALFGLLVYISRNLDNVLIGKIWGAEDLGYYGRAYFLMLLPSMLGMAVVGNVIVPALSRLQAERERLGAAYRKAVQGVALFAVPAAVGVGICAPGLIRLVYGPNWLSAAPILTWLAVAGVAQPVHNSYGWLYSAVGDGKGAIRWGFVSTAALVIAFSVGVRWGAVGVAVAYAISMGIILTIPALYFAHRSARISFRATMAALFPVGGAAITMAMALLVAGRLLDKTHTAIAWQACLAIQLAVGIATYIATILIISGLEFVTVARSLFFNASSTSASIHDV
jgi:O-antigen/teichoic acid export membrane protein